MPDGFTVPSLCSKYPTALDKGPQRKIQEVVCGGSEAPSVLK